jgi:quinol monooxygenase YgiN
MFRTRISATATAAIFICVTGLTQASSQDGPGKGYGSIPGGAFSVVAEIRAKPGKEAELRQATLPLIELVRSDPATLVYFLQENRERPGYFVFYEIFVNQGDFDAHNRTTYVQDWFAKLPELADGDVKVTRMTVLSPH